MAKGKAPAPRRPPAQDDRDRLRCPGCWSPDTRVSYTRHINGAIRRCRVCRTCGRQFHTYEVV